MHVDVIDELRRRDVVRSANNPVCDLAEKLFCDALEWQQKDKSAPGHDAEDALGTRYQIKARRLNAHNASRQLSGIRSLPQDPFDQLAGILFTSDFQVHRAALIPLAVVKQLARRVDHTNSWRFMLRDDVWLVAGVQDVTDQLRAQAARL